MYFFENHPKLRLLYCIFYLIAIFYAFNGGWIIMEKPEEIVVVTIIKVLSAMIWLFGIYISFVKADIIEDKRANAISNFKFDFISIICGISFIWELFKVIW